MFSELSKAQRSFSKLLTEFEFECIGTEKTDDEILIGKISIVFSLFHVFIVSCFHYSISTS